MPRNGSGTFTLVSGNPVVTGTTIESNWANTTLSDIATAMTDSLSRSGQGGMTAALRIADGTQGAPGVGFANETGSGLYRAGTAEVWAVVQGAQTMKIDSTGVTVPAAKATSIEGSFVFNETGADKDARFEGDTDANLLFTDASTDRVGIGTNTPSTKLHVVGDATVSGTVNATTLDLTNLEVTNIKAKDGTASASIADSTGVMSLVANPVFSGGTANGVLYLDGSKVATSGSALTFDGTNAATTGTSSATKFIPTGGTATGNGMYLSAANTLGWSTNGTKQLELDSSGNLGLGVTPKSGSGGVPAFEISGSGTGFTSQGAFNAFSQNVYYASGWKYAATGAAASYWQDGGVHKWFNAPSGIAGNAISFTQAMTLDANGRWLLGTTTGVGNDFTSIRFNSGGSYPQGLNMVDSNASASNAAFQVFRKSDDTYLGNIRRNSTDNAIYVGGNSYLALGSGDTERARITSGGDLLVGTSDSSQTSGAGVKIRPAANSISSVNPDSTDSTNTLHMYSTGAGAYRFYVGWGGTISATSATISAISDQRFKENVRDLDVGLNAVMALKPRKFDWKAGKGKDIKGDRGFIAQEFEQVFPDLIDEWKDPAPEGEEPYKSVRQDLIPVLVKAIQEQQALITALTARVAALES